MLRDAALVARKDLRIEWRSKVTVGQLAPFGLLVLVLFAFGLDVDLKANVLALLAPGLFWIAVLFAAVLAVQRSFALESADSALEGLRLSGIDPAGVFLGKGAAIAAQLLVLQLVLGIGMAVLYGTRLRGTLLLLVTCVLATIGLAAVGTLFGALAGATRIRDTLVPVLFLPTAAPVLLAATRATKAALGSDDLKSGANLLARVGDGWPWVRLLVVFTVVYTAIGIVAFGSLLEDA
jgi:heme exporter protein B